MAKLGWTFKNQDAASYDFTNSVQSFTYTQGRQNVLDNYPGGTCRITMRNNAGQVAAASLAYRQRVFLRCEGTVSFRGWVQGIIYNDTSGDANDATATILLGDAWVLAAQQIAEAQLLVSNDFQVQEIADLQFFAGYFSQSFGSSSIRGSLDYSSDWASRLNQIVASDRGKFVNIEGVYNYFPFQDMASLSDPTFSFGRTPSATVVGYQSFNRLQAIGNGTYVNSAQVTPEDLATQTYTNPQASTLGESTITISTLNTTTSDGLNTAQWVANSMADTTQQSFTINVLDVAQTSLTKLAYLLTDGPLIELYYTPPGGSSTSEWISIEGLTVNGFIDRTEIDFYLAPLTYYKALILDDAVFGVLGGVPTYNSEIDYDEIGFIYDDGNVEQGSRLGW